jgi:hypothetical protein
VLLALPPQPLTVTTWTGGALAAFWFEVWPARPIRKPSPIASSSTPTPATSVVPDEMRWPRGGREERLRVARTSAVGWAVGNLDCPRRSPQLTQ